MPNKQIKKFLDDAQVSYEIIPHPTAFTAQEAAERMHIHGWQMAKAVVLKADDRFVLAVLPAPSHLHKGKAKLAFDAAVIQLAKEWEFGSLFPGCDVGAMPPLGPLYDMEVVIDPRLARESYIVFNAGTHEEAIRMGYADFARLVQPRVADLTDPHELREHHAYSGA